MTAVVSVSDALIRHEFHRWAQANNTTNVTYMIHPSIRLHAAPLTRPILIETLGACVRSLADPIPTNAASDPEQVVQQPLNVSANLAAPDLVLLPVVFKNAYGLSVVEGKMWCSPATKRYNVDSTAVFARRRMAEEQGTTMVRGMEGYVKSAEAVVVEAPQADAEKA